MDHNSPSAYVARPQYTHSLYKQTFSLFTRETSNDACREAVEDSLQLCSIKCWWPPALNICAAAVG